MTVTTHKSTASAMTLAEYLRYDDGTDSRYELVDGILIEMPAENPINKTIATFLLICFYQLGVSYSCLAIGHQIEVISEKATARDPDLTVHSEASAAAILQDGKLLRLGQPNPRLLVEIVSSSDTDKSSYNRDYIDKRREYAQRGISEYWIVDPIAMVVLVLVLTGSTYKEARFIGSEHIVSQSFSALDLTASQVLKAGL